MKKSIIGAVVLGATVALAIPAMAIDVTPYGAIRVGTWYTASTYYNPTTGASLHDSDFSLDLQGDSLIGIRVKEGEYSGVAELGAYNPKNRGAGVELRMLFGDWNFGEGKLRVGYLPSPYVFRSEQAFDADGGFNGYGSLFDGRYAQIKVSMNNGFYVALMKQAPGLTKGVVNSTTNAGGAYANTPYNGTATTYAATNTDYDTFMPKTVAGYEGKSGFASYGGGVAGNFYKVTNTVANVETSSDDIFSLMGYAHTTIDLKPVELKFHVYGGQNLGDLMSNGAATAGSYYSGKKNSYTYGGFGQVGYIVSDKVKIYSGVSYEANKNDTYIKDDNKMAAFANLQYIVTKNFKIVPEVSFLNDLESSTGTKEPRVYAAGAKWEMSF
ncbi:MAG: hypothetical protein HGB32_15135 [Geobacteraceae bacterium]|nr:hypothetical protein [Geobacteraceae bacterium]NTW81458.1 hypothetical protein [Geobacteraceae bacterium]